MEHHIDEKEYSSLPTPTVSDQYTADLKSTQQSKGSLHSVSLAQIVNRPDLLPTPTVGHVRNHDEPIESYVSRRQDFVDGKTKGMPGASLGVAVRMELLPTPQTGDGSKGMTSSPEHRASTGHQVMLSNHAPQLVSSWGRFESSIKRWEQLTRPAPSPVKADGKDGSNRLSAEFAEWMMGLPQGWVTNIDITRNAQLKALGNGVVPQQAEEAIKYLLGISNG